MVEKRRKRENMRRDRSDSWNYILYSDGDTPSLFMTCIMPYIDYNDEWKLKQAKAAVNHHWDTHSDASDEYHNMEDLYESHIGSEEEGKYKKLYLAAQARYDMIDVQMFVKGVPIKISDTITWAYMDATTDHDRKIISKVVNTHETNEWYRFLMSNNDLTTLYSLLPGTDIQSGGSINIIREYNRHKDVLEMLQRHGSKVADMLLKAYYRLHYPGYGIKAGRCHAIADSTGERCRNKVKNGKYCHHHIR